MPGESTELDIKIDGPIEGTVEIELDDEPAAPAGDKPAAPVTDARGKDANADPDEAIGEETPEQRRERRALEGRNKRAKNRAAATADRQLIASLSETIRKQGEALEKVIGKQAEIGLGKVAEARDWWDRKAQQLRRAEAKAIADGDEAAIIKYREAYDEARVNFHHFNNQLPSAEDIEAERRAAPAAGERGQAPQVTAEEALKSNAAIFLDKYSWYDPDSGDRDSLLMQKLDNEVARSGLNPATAAYWQELERRAAAHGLDPAEEGEAPAPAPQRDPGTGRFKPAETPAGAPRGGPPVAGRQSGSKANLVTIPAELERTMREAGQWDDKVVRNRVIKNFLANQAAAKKS